MKRFIHTITMCLLFSPLCFAQMPYAQFVENSHWIYDAMHILSVELGQTTLADRQPLSKGELAEYFSALESTAIPQASAPLYGMIQDYFSNNNSFLLHNKYISFDINGIFALQGQYVHKSENEVRVDSFLRYNRTPAIISVPVRLMFTPYVDFFTDIKIKKNYWASILSYPYTNLPLTSVSFDANLFPTPAAVTAGNSFFRLTIGRSPLNIGRSLSGSMMIADTIDRLDYITASFFYKKIHLALNVIELEPTRFIFSHEVSACPINWMKIRLYEGVTVNTPFDPKYLNPMMIFHNHFGWLDVPFLESTAGTGGSKSLVGCQIGVGIDLVPIRGLRLYGQYGQNQLQTYWELEGSSTARNTPDGLGGLCGIEYIHPFTFGHLAITGEFLYASPWMYINGNKHISLYYRRENRGADSRSIMMWVANPYGPDTMGGIFQVALLAPKKYSAKFRYRFLVKGENDENFFNLDKETGKDIYYPPSDHYDPIAQARTPSANPAYFHTLSLEGSYTVIKYLELNAGLNWTVVTGKKRGHAVDFYTSITYTIR